MCFWQMNGKSPVLSEDRPLSSKLQQILRNPGCWIEHIKEMGPTLSQGTLRLHRRAVRGHVAVKKIKNDFLLLMQHSCLQKPVIRAYCPCE